LEGGALVRRAQKRQAQTVEPLDYFTALRRRWVLVVAFAVFGALAAAVTTPSRPSASPTVSTFRASHTLIRDTAPGVQRTVDLATAALLVRVGEVPKRVADEVDANVAGPVLAGQVTTVVDDAVGTISITVNDADGARAARLANLFAAEALQYLDEREQERQRLQLDTIGTRLDDLQRQIGELEGQINGADERAARVLVAQRDALIRTYGTTYEQFQNISARGPDRSGLITLEEAVPIAVSRGGFQAPSTRSGRMALGTVLGLLLGAGIAILLERIDTRLRTKEEAEGTIELPVLAEIPVLSRPQQRRREVETILRPSSSSAEAYRGLRASIRLLPIVRVAGQGPATVVLITSPGPREGKTSTVASLAATFARANESVLCIDFDTRRPELHRAFGLDDEAPALTTIEGLSSDQIMAMAQQTVVPNVRLMRLQGDPTDLLSQAHHLLAVASRHADVVLVDSPPLLATTDARELLPLVDATLLVCRVGKTSVEMAQRADELLQRAGGRALGIVLIGVPRPPSQWRYYYEAEAVADAVPAAGYATNGHDAGTNGSATTEATPSAPAAQPPGDAPPPQPPKQY
jgi:capsular exopolysaccharide synthesis family protein